MANELDPKSATGGTTSVESGQDAQKSTGGPLGLLMPADRDVWNEARRLVTDKNLRVEDLASCASQDPVIVMELLRVANALYFSAGRPPITTARTAVVRLGSDVILETLDRLAERTPIEDDDISHWFEVHRSRCKRTALVARILSETAAKTLADDCQAAGLLMHVGEMIAVIHFGLDYVKLAEEHSRSGIIYRLAQDHKFDVERVCINYLRRQGIPESLLFAIERDGRSRTPDRAVMKPVCLASMEMVEAFDSNRWDKLAPGKKMPPKSAIRMIQITDPQYLKIYERVSEYLFSVRLLEEKKKQALLAGVTEAVAPIITADSSATSTDADELQDEITNLIQGGDDNFEELAEEEQYKEHEEEPPAVPTQSKAAPPPEEEEEEEGAIWSIKPKTIYNIKEELTPKQKKLDQFNLNTDPKAKKVARVKKPTQIIAPPTLHSANSAKTVTTITEMFDKVSNGEELLSKLLAKLVDDGPFEKSALIVVSKDRKNAIVVAARGPNIGNGQTLILDDPLSPLAQCFSKVQSFGTRASKNSPFGSKSYALSPIDADHNTPVALYADCGNDGSVTFEARRIFRTVVEVLNQKLPTLPGGIPVELS